MGVSQTRFHRIGAPLNSEPLPILQWIEVATSLQIPSFQIIGLPGPEVAEARERVKAALERSGFEFPRRRVVLNLAPASIRKRGTGLDLAMALSILADREGLLSKDESTSSLLVAWGELGLDGTVKPAGQLTRTLFACWQSGVTHVLISREEEREARVRLHWIDESGEMRGTPPRLVPVSNLAEAWECISRNSLAESLEPGQIEIGKLQSAAAPAPSNLLPLSPAFERVVGIAASGAHHLLLLGPRGTGKSHALEWLIALQPPRPPRVRLHWALLQELGRNHAKPDADAVASSGPEPEPALIRRVSSQARPSALVGGATALHIRPGEFSLAHGGLLVADELPEWSRDAREALREPMERGFVTLTRAQGALELPAQFTLAANGNLCPCGGWPNELPYTAPPGVTRRPPRCRCNHGERKTYTSRLSGPVLDRIDVVYVGAISQAARSSTSASRERYLALRARVGMARRLALRLWGEVPGRLTHVEIEDLLEERPQWRDWLDATPSLSLRGRHKILRVALSLSAWDSAASILGQDPAAEHEATGEPAKYHFLEASCYRAEHYGLGD